MLASARKLYDWLAMQSNPTSTETLSQGIKRDSMCMLTDSVKLPTEEPSGDQIKLISVVEVFQQSAGTPRRTQP